MSYFDYFNNPLEGESLEEKIEIIKQNISSSKDLQSKLREIKSNNSIFVSSSSKEDSFSFSSNLNAVNEEKDLGIELLYKDISLLDISNLSFDEVSSIIDKTLSNKKYNVISISKIKLMLYREYVLYSNMLFQTFNKDEFMDIESSMKALMTKILLLDDLEEENLSEEIEENTDINNNLFFLLSNSGNIIALENLRKSVPKEYYPAFKNLLLCLKTGKLKGFKRLARQGYYEIKDFKIRITFDKLSDNNYLIIDAFMKKFDTSTHYRNRLEIRSIQYSSLKDYYLSRIQDSDFIDEHQEYFNQVLSLLDGKLNTEVVTYERKLV